MENENKTHQIDTSSMELSQDEMIREMHVDMRKAKNYMKWQLIITVALVVIPLLASLFIIPFTLKSLTNSYGAVGIEDAGSAAGAAADLLK